MSRDRSRRKTGRGQLAPKNRNDSSGLPEAPFDQVGPFNTPDNLTIKVLEAQQKTIDGQQRTIDTLIKPKQIQPPPKWAQLVNYGYLIVMIALILIALSYFLHGRYPESTASEDLAIMALSTLGALLVGMAKSALPSNK
jgi:hypothetical protein